MLESIDDNTDSMGVFAFRFAMVFLERLGSPSAFRDVPDFKDRTRTGSTAHTPRRPVSWR